MVRVLNVHDRECDFQTRRAVEQLAAGLGKQFAVETRSIGAGGDYLNIASAAWRLRGMTREYDLVHAWGMGALSAAAFSPFKRILFTPTRFPTRRHIGWIRAIAAHREVDVLSPTATIRRNLIERGFPQERCHLIRPGVDFSRIRRRRDPQLRAALGLEEGHHVLLACGESDTGANHRLALWAAAILNVLDQRTRLLIWGRGSQADGVARFAVKLGQPELLIHTEHRLGRSVEFEELLGASDIGIVSAGGPVAVLPVAICMAAALPMVATVTPTVAELLEDRHTAVMVAPNVARLIAQRVVSLRQDANLAWAVSDMARTEAYEFFPLTRFLAHHREVYQQAARGAALAVPEAAAGAGRRFHGRA